MVYDQGFSSSSSTLEAKLSPSRVDRSSLFPFAFHSPLLSLSSFHSCPHTRNPHAWQPKPSLPSPVPMIYLLPSSSCSLSLSCLSPPFFCSSSPLLAQLLRQREKRSRMCPLSRFPPTHIFIYFTFFSFSLLSHGFSSLFLVPPSFLLRLGQAKNSVASQNYYF